MLAWDRSQPLSLRHIDDDDGWCASADILFLFIYFRMFTVFFMSLLMRMSKILCSSFTLIKIYALSLLSILFVGPFQYSLHWLMYSSLTNVLVTNFLNICFLFSPVQFLIYHLLFSHSVNLIQSNQCLTFGVRMPLFLLMARIDSFLKSIKRLILSLFFCLERK